MKEIYAREKSIKDLLKNKYAVDVYQREYKWKEKQVNELIDDLLSAFAEHYTEEHERSDVQDYGQYFLGPIIVSESNKKNYIVDGQQRLTTLTLILICLKSQGAATEHHPDLASLIYSQKYGKKSFNLDVAERTECLLKLYDGESYDIDDKPQSVRNLVEQYERIQQRLMGENNLNDKQIPLFIDWFTENVYLVEIKTASDSDAYKIFESMNDRGLRLTPVEMLKGYLLSEIRDGDDRNRANEAWKKGIEMVLADEHENDDADAIKSWLRGQYANEFKGFYDIGSEFHRWVRNNREIIGLKTSREFEQFITRDFVFYAKIFTQLRTAAEILDKKSGLECVHYLHQHTFTLQYPLLLASVLPSDLEQDINRKLRVVSTYLDILVHRRIGNWNQIAERVMRNIIPNLIPQVRKKTAIDLANFFEGELKKDGFNQTLSSDYGAHRNNRPTVKKILARIIDYMETGSAEVSNYTEYLARSKFEIEHIWHADYEEVCEEEGINNLNENDFKVMRNNIGGLLLLPKKDNAYYGDKPYQEKRKYYQTQNLLAGSLHENCYESKTGFRQFKKISELPFKPHPKFHITDIEERQQLYRQIADKIWDPKRLHEAANS